MTHSSTTPSLSQAADAGVFYKTGVCAKAFLVLNWLTKVMNCEKLAIVAVEFITFPAAEYQPCLSTAVLFPGHCLWQIGLSIHLLRRLPKESAELKGSPGSPQWRSASEALLQLLAFCHLICRDYSSERSS